jgi:hypothetical protein
MLTRFPRGYHYISTRESSQGKFEPSDNSNIASYLIHTEQLPIFHIAIIDEGYLESFRIDKAKMATYLLRVLSIYYPPLEDISISNNSPSSRGKPAQTVSSPEERATSRKGMQR